MYKTPIPFRNDTVAEWKISAGVRASYWDLNEEFLLSPTRTDTIQTTQYQQRLSPFGLAGGIYAQPPFYREMRNPVGVVNTDLKAQKSAHIVGGFSYDFYLGHRPKKFKFITEAYYKYLWDLVSYEVDNVRIRYSGQNDATGYVMGLDMRVNGEFVRGAESWINLSLLSARERLDGVQHLRREIGDSVATNASSVPRPTDQFLTLSMFFQDYFPKNENLQMQLNFTVGTGLPFGLKDNNRNLSQYVPV